MIERFANLPAFLTERARTVRLSPGGIPALLAHPDWLAPTPAMIWLHGRTASKEIDAGRYSRWVKAGIAAVAVDLPAHGERKDARGQDAAASVGVLSEALADIDRVVEALADPVWQGVFDLDRLGIGGISLGGMASLRRLCDPHPFACAAVECTSGDLAGLYDPARGTRPWGVAHPSGLVAPLDPARHLAGFKPLPLLSLHSEADRIVPWPVQRGFLDQLREHYRSYGADPELIRSHTWPATGAPEEHLGFGRLSNEAKNIQTAFLAEHLLPRTR